MSMSGTWTNVSFAGSDLHGETLSGKFIDCDFSNADLRDAVLVGTFIGVSLQGANLDGTCYDPESLIDCEVDDDA